MSNRKRFGILSCGHGPSPISQHSVALQILAHTLQMQHGSSSQKPTLCELWLQGCECYLCSGGHLHLENTSQMVLHSRNGNLGVFWSMRNFRWFFRQKGGSVSCLHGWNTAAQDPTVFFWLMSCESIGQAQFLGSRFGVSCTRNNQVQESGWRGQSTGFTRV